MTTPHDLLEYIGPPGQVMFEEETNERIELVAGRRYPMSAELAAYRVSHDVNHWKRPAPPKGETAATKE